MSLLGKLFGGVPSVSVEEARTLVEAGAVMVDVRTTGEWNAGHSPSAVHIALPELGSRLHRVPKDRTVVVVCRSGNRSRGATKQLIGEGYEAVNLSGGMHAWKRNGQRLIDRAGRPGMVV